MKKHFSLIGKLFLILLLVFVCIQLSGFIDPLKSDKEEVAGELGGVSRDKIRPCRMVKRWQQWPHIIVSSAVLAARTARTDSPIRNDSFDYAIPRKHFWSTEVSPAVATPTLSRSPKRADGGFDSAVPRMSAVP